MRVAGYARVSTDRQADRGVSLAAQTEKIRAIAHGANVLGHIELPIQVSLFGIPLMGALVVWMAYAFFGITPWLSVIALFLVFFFCLIAINSLRSTLSKLSPTAGGSGISTSSIDILDTGD